MNKKSRILIVEDEMLISMEIKETLIRLGYDVAGQVITGQAAIDEAEKKEPDLILMDIRLQGEMDGIEAARTIKEKCGIPIIFLTAHSDKNTLERAIAISPSGYLIKPFNDREMFSNIEMSLHKARIRNLEKPESFKFNDGIEKTLISSRKSFFTLDLHGIITRISPEVRRIFGIERRNIVGSSLNALVGSSQNNTESVLFPEMISLIRDNGELIPVTLTTGFILDAQQNIKEIIFFISHWDT
jgi:CheY-like chemotaxis protein